MVNSSRSQGKTSESVIIGSNLRRAEEMQHASNDTMAGYQLKAISMQNELGQWIVKAPEILSLKDEVPSIISFHLLTGDKISCILWKDGKFYITGTDIVRILNFRFVVINKIISNMKKFEEGVFSDLRNLKTPCDAILEEAKSSFLQYLFRNQCIRTQKKQKIYFWNRVDHDRLFKLALERYIRRDTDADINVLSHQIVPCRRNSIGNNLSINQSVVNLQNTVMPQVIPNISNPREVLQSNSEHNHPENDNDYNIMEEFGLRDELKNIEIPDLFEFNYVDPKLITNFHLDY